ncbi:hypothetical protein predicted by Glimmer/Critica [Acetobacter senegalensis]|uniref:Uncharacterized protein n=1 Tax=Acetobacter senegalensis TaxID=446692 RepID=A0A0U5B6T7_9PROT|nr:hypothetical protein predicted by Glimmer/Critica [Acetobacter senegalensis]
MLAPAFFASALQVLRVAPEPQREDIEGSKNPLSHLYKNRDPLI